MNKNSKRNATSILIVMILTLSMLTIAVPTKVDATAFVHEKIWFNPPYAIAGEEVHCWISASNVGYTGDSFDIVLDYDETKLTVVKFFNVQKNRLQGYDDGDKITWNNVYLREPYGPPFPEEGHHGPPGEFPTSFLQGVVFHIDESVPNGISLDGKLSVYKSPDDKRSSSWDSTALEFIRSIFSRFNFGEVFEEIFNKIISGVSG